jgi:myo-inositol-1(or 4)-monophosphatase
MPGASSGIPGGSPGSVRVVRDTKPAPGAQEQSREPAIETRAVEPLSKVVAEPNPDQLAHLAGTVAREAGTLIRARYDEPRQITTKSRAVDLVTDTDRAAERLILDRLHEAFPEHGILSEETGTITGASGRSSLCWVIDPLDGTTNFAHGVPHFAVSVACVRAASEPGSPLPDLRAARAVAGAVYDPMRDELFSATEGGAATLNGRRIVASDEGALDASLLATGFPYDRREQLERYLGFWRVLMVRARDIRRMGAAALDLAWVACGRLDGFWEWRLQPWDVAAGALVVRRAGGRVTDFGGVDPGIDAAQTLATNGRVHAALLEAIAPLLRDDA